MLLHKFFFAMLALLISSMATATVVQVSFDSLSDGDVVTNQIAGLSFTNSTVIAAGQSLNESEFPPHSGSNVVVDSGGEIVIDFASPVFSAGGYFTYFSSLLISAYDASDVLLGSISSSFFSNLALSGDPGSLPNEFIEFSSASSISRLVILGDPAGFSFVMDDFTYSFDQVGSSVPEPGSLALVLISIFTFLALLRLRSR